MSFGSAASLVMFVCIYFLGIGSAVTEPFAFAVSYRARQKVADQHGEKKLTDTPCVRVRRNAIRQRRKKVQCGIAVL